MRSLAAWLPAGYRYPLALHSRPQLFAASAMAVQPGKNLVQLLLQCCHSVSWRLHLKHVTFAALGVTLVCLRQACCA